MAGLLFPTLLVSGLWKWLPNTQIIALVWNKQNPKAVFLSIQQHALNFWCAEENPCDDCNALNPWNLKKPSKFSFKLCPLIWKYDDLLEFVFRNIAWHDVWSVKYDMHLLVLDVKSFHLCCKACSCACTNMHVCVWERDREKERKGG